MHYSFSKSMIFFAAHNLRYFIVKFYTRICHILVYACIYIFQGFLKLKSLNFNFFSKFWSPWSSAPKTPTLARGASK